MSLYWLCWANLLWQIVKFRCLVVLYRGFNQAVVFLCWQKFDPYIRLVDFLFNRSGRAKESGTSTRTTINSKVLLCTILLVDLSIHWANLLWHLELDSKTFVFRANLLWHYLLLEILSWSLFKSNRLTSRSDSSLDIYIGRCWN